MPTTVEIFGKDTWPHTTAAREDYAKRKVPFRYINVKSDQKELQRMIELSGGRQVPVIVDGGRITVGFNGGTWGVWPAPGGRLRSRV